MNRLSKCYLVLYSTGAVFPFHAQVLEHTSVLQPHNYHNTLGVTSEIMSCRRLLASRAIWYLMNSSIIVRNPRDSSGSCSLKLCCRLGRCR